MPHETLGELLKGARQRLNAAGVAGSALDARLLVQHATSSSHERLVAEPGLQVSQEASRRLNGLLSRRLAGEPVSRILGEREFYGRRFAIGPTTLDPRPDTETLIEAAVGLAPRAPRLLDLGTGSGAIAVTLLAEIAQSSAVATDISTDALDVARNNARRHGVADRLSLVQSDWFANLNEVYDMILSNPPYIRSGDIASLAPEVAKFDPKAALDGGDDGLDAYRRIAAGASDHLKPDGKILMEIGAGQAEPVAAVFSRHNFVMLRHWRDLGGHIRCLGFGMAKADAAK